MTTYTLMRRLIENENNKYHNGMVTKDEYLQWQASTQNKLDVFFAGNRLTQAQYEELSGMFIDVTAD